MKKLKMVIIGLSLVAAISLIGNSSSSNTTKFLATHGSIPDSPTTVQAY
ncbi:hypothetical protein [Fictibacillus gelatini]|nr:hypothetical protein [Fictibacillus gelatini]